ncbi:MAG: pyruvate kinase [Gammaproteobacteria bacterium]|nr:pyruvate kinase [Gammaproteobacteria bacterium]MBU0772505.1 pyruvate kinase [Gammaproteobacteria bacterium]MBU0855050.1 pyruvate kinase [Gammaproteobacteria bacterium]MBU1847239.1 pyruvate kinase [Gammaproteobacteria bacterium]
MHRFTKIVATLGPASSDLATLTRLVEAGVDVVRLNFSHGKADDHRARVELLHAVTAKVGRTVGVMADLQGPKIRVGKFAGSKVLLKAGQKFTFDIECQMGDADRVGLDYPELVNDVEPGAVLLLDDGRIVMDVKSVSDTLIHCTVRHGGELSNNKGINRQGGGLSAPALTAKDMEDIKIAASLNVDYVAVSFPKCGDDMRQARELLRAAGSDARLIAKIERVEAIPALEEILEASDGAMVARGDLAVEVGDAAVPAMQKRIIRVSREMNKLVITATQMMESMINSPVPTRAEVSDVANAVLDGTDAVMLSAETASGQYPVETVEAMSRICVEAEKTAEVKLDQEFLQRVFTRIDQSIAMAALFSAFHLKVKAIATLTQSGSTSLWMSRLNSGVPIYALTPEVRTRYKLSMYRGVTPLMINLADGADRDRMLVDAEAELLRSGAVKVGDLIVLSFGEPIGVPGGTNTLKIVKVGEYRQLSTVI